MSKENRGFFKEDANSSSGSVQKQDVLQDVVIWERKQYRSPPRLCQADGPIGAYRRYCRQFYPERPKA